MGNQVPLPVGVALTCPESTGLALASGGALSLAIGRMASGIGWQESTFRRLISFPWHKASTFSRRAGDSFHCHCQLSLNSKCGDFPMSSSQHPSEEDDPKPPRDRPIRLDDPVGPFVHSDPLGNVTTFTYFYDLEPARFLIEHDRQKRLFEITGLDGKKTEFHDRAVQFLVVEPDSETGELEPVVTRGKPKVMYLCREEREPRC